MVLNEEVHSVELAYAGQNVDVTETDTSFYNERQRVEIDLIKSLAIDEAYGIGKNDELPVYRESFRVNMACRDALESAIHESYHDYCLDTGKAAAQVAAQFGMERVAYVLANTVRLTTTGESAVITRHGRRRFRSVPMPTNGGMNVAGIFSYRRSIPVLSICLSLVCARSWQKKKLRRKSAHLCLRKFRKIRRRFRQRPQRKSCRDRSNDHGQE